MLQLHTPCEEIDVGRTTRLLLFGLQAWPLVAECPRRMLVCRFPDRCSAVFSCYVGCSTLGGSILPYHREQLFSSLQQPCEAEASIMIRLGRILLNGRHRVIYCAWMALALGLSPYPKTTRANDFEMEGSAIRRSFAQSGELVASVHYRFLVRVQGTNIWIETSNLLANSRTVEIASTYDGDIYFLKRVTSNNANQPEEFAAVTTKFPSEASDVLQVLFVFLTTGFVPESPVNGSDLPFSMLEETIPEMVKIEVTRSTNAPGLMIRAAALAPGLMVLSEQDQWRQIPLLPPYTDGYRLWSYETGDGMDFDDLRLPANFTFGRFFPGMGQVKDFEDVALVTEIMGSIDRVGVSKIKLPQLPKPLHRIVKVSDFRFSPNTPPQDIPVGSRQLFYYAITNGNWRLRSDQFVQTELATMLRIESSKGSKPAHTAKQTIVVLLLVGIILAPMIGSRYSRKQHKNETKDKL